MTALVEDSAERTVVRLTGAADVSSAAELKQALSDAIQNGRPVEVSLAALTECDITIAQLLWTAAKSARSAGLRFTLSEPPPEHVWTGLAKAGIPLDTVFEQG